MTPLIGCRGRFFLSRSRKASQLLRSPFGVGILRRVAAGGVDQHGLFGEPPVAVARAADARDACRRAAAGERELQARIDERRRLAGAGRADDDVPGQVVEDVAALALRPCAASPSASFIFSLQDAARRPSGSLVGHAGLLELGARLPAAADVDDRRARPRPTSDDEDDDRAGAPRPASKRAHVADRDQRPGEPDEGGERERADERSPRDGSRPSRSCVAPFLVRPVHAPLRQLGAGSRISTRRFFARPSAVVVRGDRNVGALALDREALRLA